MATEPRFHVGDICRIKDLETIERECIRKDSDGDFLYHNLSGHAFFFWNEDRNACGDQVKIGSVKVLDGMFAYYPEEVVFTDGDCYYSGYDGGWIFEAFLEPYLPPIDSTNLAERLSDLFGEVK